MPAVFHVEFQQFFKIKEKKCIGTYGKNGNVG